MTAHNREVAPGDGSRDRVTRIAPASLKERSRAGAGTALMGVNALCLVVTLSGCGETISNRGISPAEQATTTMTVPFDATTDVSEIRNLMAASTHVFSGRVESPAGSKSRGGMPETQFTVTTGIALRGDMPATVQVNQQGGTVDGVYMSLGGDRPLESGQWYFFATRISPSEGWFTVIPVHGDAKITEQQALDPSSSPLANAAAALQANLEGAPPPQSADLGESPTLTFPIPEPGDENPPPPSPPQPTR